MGELTIRSFLHVTKSTGDTILGYPFLTRFEPLINWKERYMEIQHQNHIFRIFGIIACGSVYEQTTNHSKNTSSSSIDTIQISTQISNIHTRLEQLQTSIAKLTPISIPHSTTTTSNNSHTASHTTNTKPTSTPSKQQQHHRNNQHKNITKHFFEIQKQKEQIQTIHTPNPSHRYLSWSLHVSVCQMYRVLHCPSYQMLGGILIGHVSVPCKLFSTDLWLQYVSI